VATDGILNVHLCLFFLGIWILDHRKTARCRPFSQTGDAEIWITPFGLRRFPSRAKSCSLSVNFDAKPHLFPPGICVPNRHKKVSDAFPNQTKPRSRLHRFSFPDKNSPLKGTQNADLHLFSTGIGIPDHRKTALFRPFSQLDDAKTRRWGGTGLGLAICAQLVSLLGGKIGVDGNLEKGGRGSEFHFTMRAQTCKRSRICAMLSLTFSRDRLSIASSREGRNDSGIETWGLAVGPVIVWLSPPHLER
jgi:hypothetical protein